MHTYSKRTFMITEVNGKAVDKHESMCLSDILEDDGTELNYAIQDVIDDVLDLKDGESIYFQPNRDNKQSKGIIVRIN